MTDTRISSYFVKFAQCDADGFASQQSQWILKKTQMFAWAVYLQCDGNEWRLSLQSLQWSVVVIETLLMSSSCRPIEEMACQDKAPLS